MIGAGANGLAVLQVFADSPQIQSGDWSIVCFEDREDVGGVWYAIAYIYTLKRELTTNFCRRPAAPSSDNKPPVSAVYDSLKINLPHPIMTYQSYPFPPETPLFPTAARLLRYLEDYTEHFGLRRFIRFDTLVTATKWVKEDAVWKVSLSTGETLDFDALIVSNGHYRRPRYPEVPGLQSWLTSGRVMHSAWYRRPAQLSLYSKIVVAGGGLSANDVCADLTAVGKHVLHSIPSGPGDYPPDSDLYRKVPRIARYGDGGEIVFQDGSVELGVDFVVLAVGYECSYSFFSEPDIVDGFPDSPTPFNHFVASPRFSISSHTLLNSPFLSHIQASQSGTVHGPCGLTNLLSSARYSNPSHRVKKIHSLITMSGSSVPRALAMR